VKNGPALAGTEAGHHPRTAKAPPKGETVSLTSELANPNSPVSQFVNFIAGTVSYAKQESVIATHGLLGLPGPLSKPLLVAPIDGADPGTVGTAFDYRLRYQLASCASKEFLAQRGAAALARRDFGAAALTRSFFDDLDALALRLRPFATTLDDESEQLLDRYCVVLALLEAVYRSRGAWFPDVATLTGGGEGGRMPLLLLARGEAVSDLVNLSRSAERVFAPLKDVVRAGLPYFPNPTFAGASDVGGADADLIIGDGVFELKTTKTADLSAVRKVLLQLVGYSLLDYGDEYAIRKVGVYFVRQEFVVGWPIWQLIFPPMAVLRWQTTRTTPDEDAVTERLARLRLLMKRAASGLFIDHEAEFS